MVVTQLLPGKAADYGTCLADVGRGLRPSAAGSRRLRNAEHHAREAVGRDLLEDLAYHLDAVQLVAVDAGGEARGQAGSHAPDHQQGDVDGGSREGLAGPQEQPPLVARRHIVTQQGDRVPGRGGHRALGRGGRQRARQRRGPLHAERSRGRTVRRRLVRMDAGRSQPDGDPHQGESRHAERLAASRRRALGPGLGPRNRV